LKDELRRRARQLDPPTEEEQRLVVERLEALLRELAGAAVLVYLSKEGEVEADRVVSESRSGCRFLTTRTPESGGLTIHDFFAPREIHRLGFPQPVESSEVIPPSVVDAAFVPGLAFDLRGNRLGRGRGYYDHLISELREDVVLVGVALERRLFDEIPVEEHDIPMDCIVTEARTLWITDGVCAQDHGVEAGAPREQSDPE